MSRRLRSLSRRRIFLCACIALWVAAFVVTHLPADPASTEEPNDKAFHAGGYFVLSGMFLLALSAYRLPRGKRVVLVLGVMMIYAAIDELTQSLVARRPDPADWLADLAGTAAAIVACEAILHVLSLRARSKQA